MKSESSDIYFGLPYEFAPPRKAAQRIGQLATLAERNAYFDRIPACWQKMIRHLAALEIAGSIVAIDDIEHRREALTSVPFEWRDEVKSHVLRLWRVRERAKAAA